MVATLALLVALMSSACVSPCVDLQSICNACTDPNHKAACETSVDNDADDICEQNIDSYGNICK